MIQVKEDDTKTIRVTKDVYKILMPKRRSYPA